MKKKGLNLKIKAPVDDDFCEPDFTKEDPLDKIYHVVDNIYFSGNSCFLNAKISNFNYVF